MAVGPIEHGTAKSILGYVAEPFDGEVINGADVFYIDAGFRGVKLDFRSVIWCVYSRHRDHIENDQALTSPCTGRGTGR